MKSVIKRWAEPLRPRLSPAFFIIGAQKAGTSALFRMLAKHPGVLAPAVKEHNFFDNDANYARGIRSYRAGFPLVPLRGGKVTFEATPDYLFIEQSAERMRAHFPDAPLVAVLRDPVKRAYSAWNMFRDFRPGMRYGHLHDPRPFAQAVEEELAGHPVRLEHQYLRRGYYAGQVERFRRCFCAERLLILSYGELKADPATTLAKVCAHVGLATHTFGSDVLNTKDNVRAYPAPLDPQLAERLYDHFAPHLAELAALLAYPLDLDERQRRPQAQP